MLGAREASPSRISGVVIPATSRSRVFEAELVGGAAKRVDAGADDRAPDNKNPLLLLLATTLSTKGPEC
jgi:hypothetical protein